MRHGGLWTTCELRVGAFLAKRIRMGHGSTPKGATHSKLKGVLTIRGFATLERDQLQRIFGGAELRTPEVPRGGAVHAPSAVTTSRPESEPAVPPTKGTPT